MGKPDIEKMAENRDVEGLIKALKHENNEVRKEAAWALGMMEDIRA